MIVKPEQKNLISCVPPSYYSERFNNLITIHVTEPIQDNMDLTDKETFIIFKLTQLKVDCDGFKLT